MQLALTQGLAQLADLVAPLIEGPTRVLISHDIEAGLAEADLVLGLRGTHAAFVAERPDASEIRKLYR